MNTFKLCAAILQDFGHPKNRCWHTQLNVCEKEGFPCFLYLIQIFGARNDKNLTAIDYANQKEFNGWDDIVQILIEEAKGLDIKGVDFKDEDVSAACTNIEELDIRG